jgi:hypothetical protein
VNAAGHIGELSLRRRRTGEAADDAATNAHLAACADCRARLRALDDEQRRFESEISFDRFAAGVARAARAAPRTPHRRAPARVWIPTLAMAAAVALFVTFHGPRPGSLARTDQTDRDAVRDRGDRIKGGAGMTVRIAGASGQRTARLDTAEPLAAGERLRIGYQPGDHRYLLALSIDEHGEVTPLYPERGPSLPVPDGAPFATRYLPDSLELTGSGAERIIVLLSDRPIDVETARRAARAAYDRAAGDLSRLPRLGLPGEEFARSFAKPGAPSAP